MSSESWKIREEVEEARPEKLLKKIKAKYFPNVAKDINLQIQAAEGALPKDKPKEIHTKTQSNLLQSNFWKPMTMKKSQKQLLRAKRT